MADIKDILELTVLASGTLNVPVQTNSSLGVFNGSNIRIIGTATLSGNLNISPTGTPVKNTSVDISWEAAATPSVGRDVIIFGVTVPQSFLKSATLFTVNCLYNGSAWKVVINTSGDALEYIVEGMLADGAVTTDKIADDAVTNAKLANITRGSVKVGGATDAPTDLDAKTSGQILVGDGTDIKSVPLSGDATLAATGAITIGVGAVTTAKVDDGAITPTKMSANANKYTRDIAISFMTTAEVGVLNFIMCEDCTIDKVSGTVMSPFATDTGTVIFKNNAGVVMTGSQIDFTTGLVLGNQVTNTVTANNAFTAGQKITLELSKTTKTSGKANISLCITKV